MSVLVTIANWFCDFSYHFSYKICMKHFRSLHDVTVIFFVKGWPRLHACRLMIHITAFIPHSKHHGHIIARSFKFLKRDTPMKKRFSKFTIIHQYIKIIYYKNNLFFDILPFQSLTDAMRNKNDQQQKNWLIRFNHVYRRFN